MRLKIITALLCLLICSGCGKVGSLTPPDEHSFIVLKSVSLQK